MKTKLMMLALVAVTLMAYGCKSSDTDDKKNLDPIVGTWLSQGTGNVSVGLAAFFKTARINAEFNENGSYNVVSVDSAGTSVTYQGTYQVGTGAATAIRTIVLNQTVPTSLTSSGIFQIENNVMTYEVIQTQPALDGVAAPTVAGGFGSTQQFGGPTALWIQKFARTNR
jgi:hypothetical protein